MTRYYKTDNPAVLAIHAQIEAAKDVLLAGAKAVAAEFNGRPMFSHNIHSYEFANLVLNDYYDRADRDFWTKPNRQTQISSPRTSKVKGKSQEQADFIKKYYEMAPKSVDLEPLYKAMGTDWGNLCFSGYTMFFVDGTLYFGTSAALGEVMTEIMGSEFDAARLRYQQAQKAA